MTNTRKQPGSQAVDFDWLEAYANHDLTLVREVLTLFAAEAAEWGGQLYPEGDWKPVVHTVKGTSRSVGARTLGELCERAEAEGAELLPQVRDELTRAQAEIAEYLAHASPKSGND